MNTTNYTSQIIDLSFLASNYEKSKADFLADLHDETLCNSKLRDNAGIENLVFGNGNVNADVFFIYDSPSEKDEHSRLAMSGEVGDFFFSLLSRIGISRNDVYIAPIMKYRVKNGDSIRKPTLEEMSECLPILKRQIEIVNPKIIVALGTTAFNGLLCKATTLSVKNLRGKVFSFYGKNLVITYGASFLTHYADDDIRKQFLDDISQAIAYSNLTSFQKILVKLKQKLFG